MRYVIIFQFYARLPDFRPLGSILKKEVQKVGDPLMLKLSHL